MPSALPSAPSQPAREVILDVDTGVDDALAISFAVRHPGLNVRAITCVAGNTHVDQVVTNTLIVLDQCGAPDVPVARGAERPLLNPVYDATYFHGADGMADLGLTPPAGRSAVPLGAVELMRREILASPTPVTLVPLGPMTNIALLLRTYPEVIERLERIVFMGGSASVGNATPVAEFNVWLDPEAAAIVLDSPAPTTMYGLDVFYGVTVATDVYTGWQASDDAGVRLVGHLLARTQQMAGTDARNAGGAHLGDAGAVCVALDPSHVVVEHVPVRVETSAGISRGQTVVDRRTLVGEDAVHGTAVPAHSIDVALGIDSDYYAGMFAAAVLGRRPLASC